MDESSIQVDSESLVEKDHCDKSCPFFGTVSMIITDDNTSKWSVWNFAEYI